MVFDKKYGPQARRDKSVYGSVDLAQGRSRYDFKSRLQPGADTLAPQRTLARASNDRLRFLLELEKKREEQLKKEYEALEARRRQREEETQKRISVKRALAETDYLPKKNVHVVPSSPLYYWRNPVTSLNVLPLATI